LAGAAIGALLMAPTGSEIRDGTIGCTTCGTFTKTLIGFDIRSTLHAWYVAGTALAGLLLGFVVALTWTLIRDYRSNSDTTGRSS